MTRPRLRARTAVACLMAMVMLACSGNQGAPTTTAPSGFTVMSDAKAGVAVAVPSDWIRVPLADDPAKFDKTANDLRGANPKLASILVLARQIGQSGGTFMAVTPDGAGNVNLSVDKPKEKTVLEIARNSVVALQDRGATNVNQEQSTLDGRPAIKLSFRIPIVTDAGPVPTDEIQHYLLKDKKAYILTVAGASADVAAAIATSFRLR